LRKATAVTAPGGEDHDGFGLRGVGLLCRRSLRTAPPGRRQVTRGSGSYVPSSGIKRSSDLFPARARAAVGSARTSCRPPSLASSNEPPAQLPSRGGELCGGEARSRRATVPRPPVYRRCWAPEQLNQLISDLGVRANQGRSVRGGDGGAHLLEIRAADWDSPGDGPRSGDVGGHEGRSVEVRGHELDGLLAGRDPCPGAPSSPAPQLAAEAPIEFGFVLGGATRAGSPRLSKGGCRPHYWLVLDVAQDYNLPLRRWSFFDDVLWHDRRALPHMRSSTSSGHGSTVEVPTRRG